MSKVFLVLAILLSACAFALAYFNQAPVPMRFFSVQVEAPMYLLIIKCYLLGVFSSWCITLMQRKEIKVDQKKLEWKTEDAKLQTEIQSDKVHQLELQVKTLESALDKALKRSKS